MGGEYLRQLRTVANEISPGVGLVTLDRVAQDLRNGDRYTFAHLFEDVSDGDTVRIFVDNDTDDSVEIFGGLRQVHAEGTVRGESYSNVTQDSAGTAKDPRNDLITADDSADESGADWEYDGSYSDLGDGLDLFNPGGTAEGNRTGGLGVAAFGQIEAGANLLWELESQSSNNDIFFRAVYSEGAAAENG